MKTGGINNLECIRWYDNNKTDEIASSSSRDRSSIITKKIIKKLDGVKKTPKNTVCSKMNCHQKVFCKNQCSKHYNESVRMELRVLPCKQADCKNQRFRRELCSRHYDLL